MTAPCCLNSISFTHHAASMHTQKQEFSTEMHYEVKSWQRKLHRKLTERVGSFSR